MSLLDWNDGFSVKVATIDEQHKKLVEILNTLHDAMRQGKGRDVLGKVLGDLIEYTVYHFGTEERMFRETGYPGEIGHRAEHEDLKKKVLDVKEKFEKGSMMITIEVMHFLKDWLNTHIMNSDMKAGEYLASKGVK